MHPLLVSCAGALLLALGSNALGGQSAPQPAATSTQPAPAAMPPALRLGDRIAQSQQRLKVIPDVVLVRDQSSYLEALAAWSPSRRFPVLIDDGTPQAAEMIAQFVRAFSPGKVWTWSSTPQPADNSTPFAVVDETALRGSVARAWDLPENVTPAGFVLGVRENRVVPPGAVILDLQDPAWVAGAALSAHRGQPILVRDLPQDPNGTYSAQQADELNTSIAQELGTLGLSFDAQHDDIEALTITANCPAKIAAGGGEAVALTDRLGRPGTGIEMTDRWAWAGQIGGSAPRAAFVAMSSIFLVPRSTWMFDGYPNDGPWAQYDLTKAGDELRAQAWSVEVLDTPTQGARDWRLRAARPIDAGMLLVNTKGNFDFFDLEPGQAKPEDVPILAKPAILHIIHSWSAYAPGNRDLLAGRWMERGVYCYVGSVHEPYLQAFLPGTNVMKRALAGGPLGAAVRHDRFKVWKVGFFGDPLIVIHSGMTRSTDALPLAGARDVLADLREHLKAEKFTAGFRALLLAGRDSELARLAGAVVRDKPTSLTPDCVTLVVLPLFRQQRIDDLFNAYALLDRQEAARPDLRDCLWLAAYPRLSTPTNELAQLLRSNVRMTNIGRDAAAAASVIARGSGGMDAAKAWLDQLRASITDKGTLEQLKKATDQAAEAWGQ